MQKLKDLGMLIAIFIMFAIMAFTVIILLVWLIEPDVINELINLYI